MLDSHKDNPNELIKWVEGLDSHERAIFQVGYITAIHRVVEQVTDSKLKIASKMLDEEISEEHSSLLQSRLDILDIYDKHYTNLINTLENKRQLQP